MGQEFVIKSTTLEDKINQLLPSQGGQQAGVDLSASTTIIPIVDLTETAEGSSLRQDLQVALSHDTITSFFCNNNTVTIANTVSHVKGGGIFGTDTVPASQATVTLGKAGEAGATLIIRKQPTDTINGGHAEVKGTKIADFGG